MNRFEALHALGLEENASEEDVRLAYYGLEKAVGAFDFSDSERIDQRVKGMVEHAKESRNFLLSVRNQTVARKVRSFASKQRGKLSVTPVEEKTARLHGLEQLRGVIVSYHSEERSKRRGSIIALLACIVVGFIGIRYLRGGPRVVAFSIIGAIAVAGSTILTASHLQVRKARAHVLAHDGARPARRRARFGAILHGWIPFSASGLHSSSTMSPASPTSAPCARTRSRGATPSACAMRASAV